MLKSKTSLAGSRSEEASAVGDALKVEAGGRGIVAAGLRQPWYW